MLKSIFLILATMVNISGSLRAADPVVAMTPAGPLDTQINQAVTITATGTDPDFQTLTFLWSFSSLPQGASTPTLSIIRVSLETSTATFTPVTPGAYVLQVIVDDTDGNPNNTAISNILINAVENRNLYVQANGNDNQNRSDVTLQTPLGTLDRALVLAEAGDSIILLHSASRVALEPTTYLIKELIWNKSGTSARQIILRGEERNFIHIRPQAASDQFGIRLNQAAFVRVQDLAFLGYAGLGIHVQNSQNIQIDSTRFESNTTGILLDGVGQVQITNSQFLKNRSGIHMLATTSTAIALNTFYRNRDFGLFMAPGPQIIENRINNNTFYDNGRTWAPPIRHAAISNSVTFEPLNASQQNNFHSNLFVNNIKDWFAERFSHLIDKNLSFANIEPEADPRFANISATTVWLKSDPLLLHPEALDFRPITGSPLIGQGLAGTNIGAEQSLAVSQPATGILFVDLNTGTGATCGNQSNPCSTLGRALELAPMGSTIRIQSTKSINPIDPPPHYRMDLTKLKATGPGWGAVTIEGFNSPALIDCQTPNSDAVLIQNKNYLVLRNLYITDTLGQNTLPVTSSCDLSGFHIKDSRHIRLESVMVQGQRTAVLVNSSDNIRISSGVFFLNSSQGLNLMASQDATLGFPRYSHRLIGDKITFFNNSVAAVSSGHSIASTLHNMIFSQSPACVVTDSANTRVLSVQFSLCDRNDLTPEPFLVQQNGNLMASSAATRAQFRTTSPLALRQNPREALLQAFSAQSGASPGLNSADPSWQPSSAVLPEFFNAQTINGLTQLPVPQSKTSTGRMDMGAFEQSISDVDNDFIPNLAETSGFLGNGLNPNNPLDAALDFDGDGLDNLYELSVMGTCIATPSGVMTQECTKPIDTDLDSFTDFEEFLIGSNPRLNDAALILANLPKPVIEAHRNRGPPGQYELNAREAQGRNPTNLWSICQTPLASYSPCLSSTDYSNNVSGIKSQLIFTPTFRTMTFAARVPGIYRFGVDQTVVGGNNFGGQLVSLPADRALTTFEILDVPPTVFLPPSRTILGVDGRTEHFYGSATATNPSIDANGQNLLYLWKEIYQNPDCLLVDATAPNPSIFLKNKSYLCQFEVLVTQIGGQNLTSRNPDPFVLEIQGTEEGVFVQPPTTLYTSPGLILTLDSKPSLTTSQVSIRVLTGLIPEFLSANNSVVLTTVFFGNPARLRFANVGTATMLIQGTDGNGRVSIAKQTQIVVEDNLRKVPVAKISGDRLGVTSQVIRLNGSASTQAQNGNNSGLTYRWRQAYGPPVSLADSTQTLLDFQALDAGVYGFSLSVTNTNGLTSLPTLHEILIEDRRTVPLQANISAAQRANSGRTVILSGAASSPRDCSTLQNVISDPGLNVFEFVCSPVLQFQWRQVFGPEPAKIITSQGSDLGFVPKKGGTYSFGLTVINNRQRSLETIHTIQVDSDSQRVPVASAGANRSGGINELIPLDGRGSYDPDGDALTFQWRQIEGLPVAVARSNESLAEFKAEASGIYRFELSVFDGQDFSTPSQVLVNIFGPSALENPSNFSSYPTVILDEDTQKTAAQGNRSGCFIVSAAFGQESLLVNAYSWIRDHILLVVPGGRQLVEAYYLLSPPLAEQLRQSPMLKLLAQAFLLLLLGLPPLFLFFLLRLSLFVADR